MINTILQRLFPTTVDRRTSASNPGNIQISYWKYFRSFPQETRQRFSDLFWWLFCCPTFNLGYWLAGHSFIDQMSENYSITYPNARIYLLGLYVLFGLLLNFAFIHGLFGVLKLLNYWLTSRREHFSFGCVNPAIVVSQSPPLVAVATDLRKWDEPYPVIKILEQPLQTIPGGVPAIGTRLATVALYWAGAATQQDHWADFTPIVVNCVTDDQTDIDRVFNSIQREDWQDLEAGLRRIEKRTQPGLYFVNTLERYVAPEGAAQATDFVPIAQLDLFDVRDVLRMDYQTGTVLQLHRGFPSAQASWAYEWKGFMQMIRKKGFGGVLMVVLTLLGVIGKLLRPSLEKHHSTNHVDESMWIIWAFVGFSVLVPILLYIIIYPLVTPFLQSWKFDRISGTLTVTGRSMIHQARTVVYPLGRFQNIDILDKDKGGGIISYSLILKKVQKRGFLLFKPKPKHLLLTKIANSEHPELDQRFQIAQQVRFTVRQFMDWPIV
jgi:Protein of unknown function (DUF3239)